MKITFTILTLLIAVSCGTSKNLALDKVLGEYHWSGFYGVSRTIALKADSTFEFEWWEGLAGGVTHGTWRVEKGSVILNSYLQKNESKESHVVKTEKNDAKELLIRIVGPDNEPIPFAVCAVKNDTTILVKEFANISGELNLLKTQAMDSLIVGFVGCKPLKIKIDKLVSKYIIKLEKSDDYYMYFTEEKWKLKKGRLYDPSIKKSKYVKNKYFEKEK